MLNALALSKEVFVVKGSQEEVVLRGKAETVELVLVILELHRTLPVRVWQSMGCIASVAPHALAQVIGLLRGEGEQTFV